MKVLITESQFDSLFIDKKVMVYYNLHKHTFSITYDSKVIMHADYVKLGDAEFRVRPGGKDRVRKEIHKELGIVAIDPLDDNSTINHHNDHHNNNTNTNNTTNNIKEDINILSNNNYNIKEFERYRRASYILRRLSNWSF
jgi:hypothetical protein